MKNLKVKSSQITQVGPESHHKCPYKCPYKHRGDGHVPMVQRLERCCHKSRKFQSHQKKEEAEKDPPLEPLKVA